MFFLNGKACIEPAILKLSLGEAGSFCWWDKYSANHFRMQCGVDPGEGYLLLNAPDIPHNSTSVSLTIGNVTIPNVVVIRSVEVVPRSESTSSTGTRLVEVADTRCYLKRTQVKKNYNVIRYFGSDGNAVFDETTMKDLGGSTYTNWTWETLIQDLWADSLLSGDTLNLDDATFPEVFPNNYYFENWTHRDALGQVLLDLGFTLEPNTNGTWRVVGVSSDSVINSTIANNRNSLIDANNFTDGNGGKIPSKLIFHFLFPEESPSKENRTYQYEHTVAAGHSYQSILSNSHDSIICPLAAEFDFTDTANPVNKLDLDLWASTVANRLIKLLWTDDGPDVTFGGILNIYPSADVGRVTWKNTGSNVEGNGTGMITRVEHFFPIPKLPKLHRPTVPLQKVVGYATSNITPEMVTFFLGDLELISGIKPQEPLQVNNTYGRSFSAGARVEAEYSYEFREWNTPEAGTSSSPSQSLIRFELKDDKPVDSLTANAFHINPNNFDVLADIVVIDSPDQRYPGLGIRIDPQFGAQHGFRGWGQFAYSTVAEVDEEEVTTNFYYIMGMEGPARYIDGETFQEVNEDTENFICRVFNYWGASPNHRAPVTFFTEGTSQEEEIPVLRVYDLYGLITETFLAGAKYRAVLDEKRGIYILVSITADSLPKGEQFGLLIKDLPACTYTTEECTQGFVEQGVKLFTKQRTDPNDEDSPHKLKYAGITYDALNLIWPTIVKAGETTNEDKPVVVTGYLDKWQFGDEDEPRDVFIVRNFIYPITIIMGTSAGTVTGTGPITVNSFQTLWGRPPEVTSIEAANPEGWEGPNPSTVIAMQIVDGTWLALYVTCP